MPKQRAFLGAGAILTLALALLYGYLAFGLPGDADITGYGSGLYDMDVRRVVTDLTSTHRGYRTSVHPLQKLFAAPIGIGIDAVFFGGRNDVGAAQVLIAGALIAQAWLVALLVLQLTDGSRAAALAAAAIWGTSFSTTLAASLPESAALSGIAATLPLVYLGWRRDRKWTRAETLGWAALGVLCLGLTITQIVHWAIALAMRVWLLRRHAAADERTRLAPKLVTIVALLVAVSGAGVAAQSALFPGTENPFATNPIETERAFFRTANLAGAPASHTLRLASHFALYDFVAPLPAFSDFLIRDYGLEYWSVSVEAAGLSHWSLPQRALALLVLAAVGYALIGLRRQGDPFTAPLLCVASQFGLHLLYGREYVLYSPNWHGVWVAILVASAWNATRRRPLVLVLAAALAIAMTWNDAVVLDAMYRELDVGLDVALRDLHGARLAD